MTENTPEYQRYQQALVAATLWNSRESKKYSNGSLEALAGKKGLNLGEEALGFVAGTQASEKGMETAIGVYHEKFQEELGKQKLGDLGLWYNPILEGLEDNEKSKLLKALSKYDITIGNLKKEVQEASWILEAPEGKVDEKEREAAKETLKKYEETVKVFDILNSYKVESLRPEAVNATRIQELKGLAKKL